MSDLGKALDRASDDNQLLRDEIERLRARENNRDELILTLIGERDDIRAKLAESNSKLAALSLCEPGFLDRKLRELDTVKAQFASTRKDVIEECLGKALDQRCQRGTPWDLAVTTIADEIRKLLPLTDENGNSK